MNFTKVLEIFRLVAKEFTTIEDSVVAAWVELTEPLVCKKRFGRLWAQALALLTAHRMKLANAGTETTTDPLAGVGGVAFGNLMRVANYSEAEVSLGFNHNIGQYKEIDAELALTEYGIQYLTLRRMVIIPIVSAGEAK